MINFHQIVSYTQLVFCLDSYLYHKNFIKSYKSLKIFIYLFLAVMGLHCCTWALLSCSKWELLFLVVCRLLEYRLSSCGPWVELFQGMWDSPKIEIEFTSPSLVGEFLTSGPPEKPIIIIFMTIIVCFKGCIIIILDIYF